MVNSFIKTIKISILHFSIFYAILSYATTPEKTIRLAILDNFNFQPNIATSYETYYLKGLETAKLSAKKKGYILEYKIFKYPRGPLEVLTKVPEIEAWHPDAIIGPRSSNMFLTIQHSFKNILVISPHASSSDVEKMPSNYYSLSFPDKFVSKAILKFLNKHHPHHGIFAIVEADCKNCIDISHEAKLEYLKNYPNKTYTEKLFLQHSVKELDMKTLLKGYQSDDVIFLPNTSYTTAILIVLITNYFNKPMFFMGGDDWGTFQHSVIGDLKANAPYDGVRVSSWVLTSHYKYWNDFKENYYQCWHQNPENAESLLAYAAVSSVIDAIIKFPEPNIKKTRDSILASYMHALKNDKNWYRNGEYRFYRNVNNNDFYIDAIKVLP